MPPRVAHITTDFRPAMGGAEVYVHQLIEALRPVASEQVVFQLDNSERDPSLRGDPSVVLVPRMPWRWKWSRGHNLYWFNWQLKKRRLREPLAKFDLLIVHYPFHWPPVAWHPRVIAVSHCVEWEQPPRTRLHRRRLEAAKRCDQEVAGLVANDTNFWREMGRQVPPKTKLWEAVAPRRWCMPNGVDTDRFSPDVPPATPENLRLWLTRADGRPRPFVLVARNAAPHRGIHLAIEALGHVARRHPDLALVVVGQRAKSSYARVIDEATKRQGITDRVCHLGHVPREQMPGLYRAAALTLVPTIRHEGTSYAALEAMACGTATISTAHGGLADLPTVQVKTPDAALLAKAIEQVLPQCEEIGTKQRAVVAEKFTLARWGEAWRAAVLEVLAMPPPKPPA